MFNTTSLYWPVVFLYQFLENCARAKGGGCVKVMVLKDFRDREDKLKLKKAGSILEVSQERAKKLEGLRIAEIIKEQTKQAEEKG